MEYRKLGRSGLTVSALRLGTMTFGDRTDESEARRIVGAAAEAGVNFIDTADQYAKGESERVTGKAIAANSASAPIASTSTTCITTTLIPR
jgi:aryl-alcohol dehydrogenase-like predicted oxidoreductase